MHESTHFQPFSFAYQTSQCGGAKDGIEQSFALRQNSKLWQVNYTQIARFMLSLEKHCSVLHKPINYACIKWVTLLQVDMAYCVFALF